jgi:hypothetical protein
VPVFIGCPSIIEHRLFPPFVQLRRRNEKLWAMELNIL